MRRFAPGQHCSDIEIGDREVFTEQIIPPGKRLDEYRKRCFQYTKVAADLYRVTLLCGQDPTVNQDAE